MAGCRGKHAELHFEVGAVGFIDWLDILCVLEEREKSSF